MRASIVFLSSESPLEFFLFCVQPSPGGSIPGMEDRSNCQALFTSKIVPTRVGSTRACFFARASLFSESV